VLRASLGGAGPLRWHTLIRIPPRAKRRILSPVEGKAQEGVEYRWRAEGRTIKVRIHDRHPSVTAAEAVPVPNALVGWVVRVRRGKRYTDAEGRYHPWGELNPKSSLFNESLANATHIPIDPPTEFP